MSEPIIARGSRVTVADQHVFPGGHVPERAARVMAVADGYAMCRYPRCNPFVEPLKNLQLAGEATK